MTPQQRGRRNRRAGKQRERQWAERLLADGWEVAFRPRVDGEQPFDVLASKAGVVVLDELKSTRAGAYVDFGPTKRQALKEAASRAGGSPRLVWWPHDRKGPRVYGESEWPT